MPPLISSHPTFITSAQKVTAAKKNKEINGKIELDEREKTKMKKMKKPHEASPEPPKKIKKRWQITSCTGFEPARPKP
jgi:hypothetical protein